MMRRISRSENHLAAVSQFFQQQRTYWFHLKKATMQPLALYDFVSIEQLMNLEVAAKTVHHVIECDFDRVILSHVKMSLGYVGAKAEAF